MKVVNEESTNCDQILDLTILEEIKEQQIVNDKYGKTIEEKGQWLIGFGRIKKVNKNVEDSLFVEKVNIMSPSAFNEIISPPLWTLYWLSS